MSGIRFLHITRKSRNFHAFTQAYRAHAQTNFPAAYMHDNRMKRNVTLANAIKIPLALNNYLLKNHSTSDPIAFLPLEKNKETFISTSKADIGEQ